MGRYPFTETALTFLSSCLLAVLALKWATSQFRRESVLFRHAEDIRWSPFRRPMISRPLPTAAGAFAIFLVVLILVFFVGARWQSQHLLQGLLKTELLLILLPPILALAWGRRDLRASLGLKKPPQTIWLPTLIFMLGGWLLAVELASMQNFIVPFPSELLESLQGLFVELNRLPIHIALFYVAFLPALCEELLCRGFLLQAWFPRLGKTRAILAVGIVFGVLHLDPYRFLPTAFLGVLLSILAVESGSIFPAMLGHALVNGLTFLVQRHEKLFSGEMGFQLEQEFLPWYLVVAAGLLFVAGWRWLRRVAQKGRAESALAKLNKPPSIPA